MAMLRGSLIVGALAVMVSGFMLAGGAGAASKGSAKKAPVEPPMRFHIVRSAQEACEPDCPEWIAAQGQIVAGTLAQFKKVLRQAGKRNLPIFIHSGGGSADESLAIGRLLRTKGLDVAVARTVFTPCEPGTATCRKKAAKTPLRGSPAPDFSVCASSCAFVLAAGTRRFVDASALVGVHRGALIQTRIRYTYQMVPYRDDDGRVKFEKKLIGQKVISQKEKTAPEKVYDGFEEYLVAMGVGKDIMPLILGTPHNSIHWLTREELYSTRLATHRMSGADLLVGSTVANDGWAAPAVTGTAPESPSTGTTCQQFGGVALGCSLQFAPDSPPRDQHAPFTGLPSAPSR